MRLHLATIAVLTLGVLAAAPARADATDDVRDGLHGVQQDTVDGMTSLSRGETQDATDLLRSAGDRVATLLTLTKTPGFFNDTELKPGKVRKSIKKLKKPLKKALKAVERGKANAPRKVRSAFDKVDKVLAKSVGSPLKIVNDAGSESFDRKGGFRDAGDPVFLRILGCDQTVTDVLVNNPATSPDVIDAIVDTSTPGVVALTMGTDDGGASVTFTACGRTYTKLLYNYGGTRDDPGGGGGALPAGDYALTSAILITGGASGGPIFEQDATTDQYPGLSGAQAEALLTAIEADLDTLMQNLSGTPCSRSRNVTPWNGTVTMARVTFACSGPNGAFDGYVDYTLRKVN